MKHVHSGRIERWLGAERIQSLSQSTLGWYGKPIPLLDVPGSVAICGDGDFVGTFDRGYFASAADNLFEFNRSLARRRHGVLGSGFTNVADAVSRLAVNDGSVLAFGKGGVTATVGGCATYFFTTGNPVAGSLSAAPGGTAHAATDAGALNQPNPNSGTLHLLGVDLGSNNTITVLVYDRLFSVSKTMNSTATEAVTGVPTRYQSNTGTAADYAGGNFAFIECIGPLPATAHNWTVCTYTNQTGTAGQSFPSLAGISSCGASRLDMAGLTWFMPLAAGDSGVSAISQMQCSALVAGGSIGFAIGHPLGFAALATTNAMTPYEWITNRNQAPRVFDNACISFLQVPGNPSSATLAGTLTLTRAA